MVLGKKRERERRKRVIPKILELIICLLAGSGLGTLYFTGLWWTVRKLPSVQNPALLSLGSFLLRTVVAVMGFYFIMGGQWQRLLMCLLGFMTARVLLVKRLKPGELRDRGRMTAN
jgi:F1F0 ATPase subunit 2